MMVAWWKRLIYSLAAVVLGAGLTGAWVAAQQFVASSHGHFNPIALITAIVFFDSWVVLLSLPGWLLGIPLVLLVKNIRGWRFWMYWAIGVCFGPLLVLGVAFYNAARAPNFAGFPDSSMSIAWLAGAISGLATLFYLLLLRRGQALASLRESSTVA